MLPDYVTRPFRLYAKLQGRSSRREYWCFFAMFYAILFAAVFVAGVLDSKGMELKAIVFAVFALLLIPAALALKVRRLHDFDASGWWVLASGVPYLGVIVDLFFALKAGDDTENRFGPNPRVVTEPAA
jgi:uncharacterized membrane protein YhaH (DUF805 family)